MICKEQLIQVLKFEARVTARTRQREKLSPSQKLLSKLEYPNVKFEDLFFSQKIICSFARSVPNDICSTAVEKIRSVANADIRAMKQIPDPFLRSARTSLCWTRQRPANIVAALPMARDLQPNSPKDCQSWEAMNPSRMNGETCF